MDIGGILFTIYCIIGVILSLYWFDHEYSEEYERVIESGEPEKGLASMMMLLFIVFWPIKLVKNIIKSKHI